MFIGLVGRILLASWSFVTVSSARFKEMRFYLAEVVKTSANFPALAKDKVSAIGLAPKRLEPQAPKHNKSTRVVGLLRSACRTCMIEYAYSLEIRSTRLMSASTSM